MVPLLYPGGLDPKSSQTLLKNDSSFLQKLISMALSPYAVEYLLCFPASVLLPTLSTVNFPSTVLPAIAYGHLIQL
jgi:hypothetical protein